MTPDADALEIPLLSEAELASSLRGFPGPAPWVTTPSVTTEGASVIYSGDMHPHGYAALLKLAQQGGASELVISSLGGEVYWGIKIGEIVHEQGWDVRVRGLCFSSCANYVFPAGRDKVIEEGAIVGWHGSARQAEFFAEREGVSLRQQLADSLAPALRESGGEFTQEAFTEAIVRNIALSETRIELERLYYERIGVDSDISVYGFLPAHFAVTVSAHFAGIVATRGWTFSLGDMAKFGLDGLTYEGGGAYPSDQARALFGLALLEVDDR